MGKIRKLGMSKLFRAFLYKTLRPSIFNNIQPEPPVKLWRSLLLSSSPSLLLPPWELLISLCTLVLAMLITMYLLGRTTTMGTTTTILGTTMWDMLSLDMSSLDTTKYMLICLPMLDPWSGVDKQGHDWSKSYMFVLINPLQWPPRSWSRFKTVSNIRLNKNIFG